VVETAAGGNRLLVVKIGGSLAETGRMQSIVPLIATAHVPVVVVPGGGPFADSIRALQPVMKFDDALAHRLAMLAMHQMAEMITAQQERLRIVETLDEISDALHCGKVPVWAPLAMIANDDLVSAGWDATSDSLAARLAELLGARLLLLKSVNVAKTADLEELAHQGVVDALIPSIVARSGLSWSIFGPSDDALLRATLECEGDC
jgi:aspartokinase-like uncharacterized kinase